MSQVRPPSGPAGQPSTPKSGTPPKENRVKYNPHTKSFEPSSSGNKNKTTNLLQTESKVNATKRITADPTSKKVLQKLKTKTQIKGEQLKKSTEGVKAFFSGNSKKLSQFLSSLRSRH